MPQLASLRDPLLGGKEWGGRSLVQAMGGVRKELHPQTLLFCQEEGKDPLGC